MREQAELRAAASAGDLEHLCAQLAAGAAVVNQADSAKTTALIMASSKGHIGCVRALLKARAAVDWVTNLKMTALMWASEEGHIECVRSLLAAGAAVDMADYVGETALVKGTVKGHTACVCALLGTGCRESDGLLRNECAHVREREWFYPEHARFACRWRCRERG